MADIVCYGQAGGQEKRKLLSGRKGTVHDFSLDEWLHKDIRRHSEKLAEIMREAARLMRAGRLKVETHDYCGMEGLTAAKHDACRQGRLHTVVMHFPPMAATDTADLTLAEEVGLDCGVVKAESTSGEPLATAATTLAE